MSLLLLLAVLLLGMALGWKLRRCMPCLAFNRHALRVSLWVLLAVMGAKLAAHRALFARDPSLFLLAIASSLLLLLVFTGLFALAARLAPPPRASAEDRDPLPPETPTHSLASVAQNGGCILAGAVAFLLLPSRWAAWLPLDPLTDWTLRALLLCIGFDLGAELPRLDLRKLPPILLLAPFVNIALSLGTGLLLSLFTRLTPREGMLLTAGLGWYTLSSVLLAERGMVLLSLLAFLHNVFRELLAILSAPLAARLSPYLPVYLGGATSMDVMLPFVQRHCGREYTLVSFYSGVVCSLAVMPLVRMLAGA